MSDATTQLIVAMFFKMFAVTDKMKKFAAAIISITFCALAAGAYALNHNYTKTVSGWYSPPVGDPSEQSSSSLNWRETQFNISCDIEDSKYSPKDGESSYSKYQLMFSVPERLVGSDGSFAGDRGFGNILLKRNDKLSYQIDPKGEPIFFGDPLVFMSGFILANISRDEYDLLMLNFVFGSTIKFIAGEKVILTASLDNEILEEPMIQWVKNCSDLHS